MLGKALNIVAPTAGGNSSGVTADDDDENELKKGSTTQMQMSQITHGMIEANASHACFLILFFFYIQHMYLVSHDPLSFRLGWSGKQDPDRNDIALPATFTIFQPHELLC